VVRVKVRAWNKEKIAYGIRATGGNQIRNGIIQITVNLRTGNGLRGPPEESENEILHVLKRCQSLKQRDGFVYTSSSNARLIYAGFG